jgi:(5-formylfuran-3-yl)methyl phosphate synthase
VPAPSNLKLLVSYQNAAELLASEGCLPDWIDLKNPDRGSLGCPTADVAAAFLKTARGLVKQGKTNLSIAVGELRGNAWLGMEEVIAGFDFAKVGLENCVDNASWSTDAIALSKQLKLPERLILCYYADAHRAHSPGWEQVLDASQAVRAPYILIDTFDKQAGRIWDWCCDLELLKMRDSAAKVNILVALAGSLRLHELARAAQLGIDVVGLRGAVCEFGSRVEPLCRDRLRQALEALQRHASLTT